MSSTQKHGRGSVEDPTEGSIESPVQAAHGDDVRNGEESQETLPEGPAPTPFDHPLFLPILLCGLMLWFGYDGFINADPDMLEHRDFNRIGFGILLAAALYTGIRGYKEWVEDREDD